MALFDTTAEGNAVVVCDLLTEHADLTEDWYAEAVVEKWRGGTKLVPADWPRAGDGGAE